MRGPPQIVPDENALTVFTDGASLPAPRRGGIGVHFVHTDSVGNESYYDLSEPGYMGASNNQMELQAVITALRFIDDGRLPPEMLADITKIDVYTDSLYVATISGTRSMSGPTMAGVRVRVRPFSTVTSGRSWSSSTSASGKPSTSRSTGAKATRRAILTTGRQTSSPSSQRAR
jgi:ribonuclease HI